MIPQKDLSSKFEPNYLQEKMQNDSPNTINEFKRKELAEDLLNDFEKRIEASNSNNGTIDLIIANIKKTAIKISDEIKPPEWVIEAVNTDGSVSYLGSLGNFILITGKAKARKSFFVGLILSATVSNGLITERYRNNLPENKKQVVYFDTEQGKYHVQLALKRVSELSNNHNPENLDVYGLRSLSVNERLQVIEHVIYNTPNIGVVVIDGIRDLVSSINDEDQATMISNKLLKWTEEKNIQIITVLHQNKGDNNARGHLGTELINKAETVLSVTKSTNNPNISIVEAEQCRNKEPESFAFEIDENGLPIAASSESIQGSEKKSKDPFDYTQEVNRSIIQEVFRNETEIKYKDLQDKIKYILATYDVSIGNNKLRDWITYFKENQMIIQDVDKGPYKLNKVC
ncbi:AAA family ATPase [Christiangramia sp.]|uniref:AAA family ATPase n=1 Tax=Christiangramia sp. TaxID=1931228 RepID=UPI0026085C6E|nr:AAA family ATPase [Christiangramia sp.]